MKKLILISALAMALTACGPNHVTDPSATDQCLRVELFKQCMAIVPKGPRSTVYNDWAEVVDECESAAYYQSIRPKSQIKEECRSSR